MKPRHEKQQYTTTGNEKAYETYAMQSSLKTDIMHTATLDAFPTFTFQIPSSRLLCSPSNPFILSWLSTTIICTTFCPHTWPYTPIMENTLLTNSKCHLL